MERLFLVTLAILAFTAVTHGKKWNSCERRIKRFERCLEKGYKSKAGCISGEGTPKKRSWRRCGRLENKIAQKCDYVCEKPLIKMDDECLRKIIFSNGDLMRVISNSSMEECKDACSEDRECKSLNYRTGGDREGECELLYNEYNVGYDYDTNSMKKGCKRFGLDYNSGCYETSVVYLGDGTHNITVLPDPNDELAKYTGFWVSPSETDEHCFLMDEEIGPGSKMKKTENSWFDSANIDLVLN